MGSGCSSVEAYREAIEDAFFACLLSLSDNRLHILRFARQHSAEEKKRLPGISVAEFMRASVRPLALIPSSSDGSLGRLSFRGVDIGLVSQRNGAYRVCIGDKLAGEVSPEHPCLILNYRDIAGRHQLLTEAVLWGRASIPSTLGGSDALNAEQRKLIRSACSRLKFQNHHCYWGAERSHVFKCGICLLSPTLDSSSELSFSSWDQLHWHLYFFHGISRYYIAKYFSKCLCRVCNGSFSLREANNCRCPATRWAAPSVRLELLRALNDNKGKVPDDLDPFHYLSSDATTASSQSHTSRMPTSLPPIVVTAASHRDNLPQGPSDPTKGVATHQIHLTDFPNFSDITLTNGSIQNLTASSKFPLVSDLLLQVPPDNRKLPYSSYRGGTSAADAWQDLLSKGDATIDQLNPPLFVSDDDSVVSWPSLVEPDLKLNLTGESFRPQRPSALVCDPG